MDLKRYDRDGKYAATYDFELYCRDSVISNVFNGYMAVAASVIGGSCCECPGGFKWASDYIQTSIKLLGYSEISSLVKTNFRESALAFSDAIDKEVEKEKQAAGVRK